MATSLPSTVTPSPTSPATTTAPPVKRKNRRETGSNGGGPGARRMEDWKGKGRRVEGRVDIERKATGTGPVAEGYPDCSNVGNDQLSCFPLSNTTIVQDDYSKFIWNFNYPLFIANNDTVDVYLYLASSDELIQSWADLPNSEGQLAFVPEDSWWESSKKADVLADDGVNPWEVYFVIVPGGHSLNGAEVHQSTFTANQTAIPVAVSLSQMSVSSTASVASASRAAAAVASTKAASVSSVALASSSSKAAATTGSANGANGANGSLQGLGGGDGFPKWAIALLSVLGAALLLTVLALLFLFLRRIRRRERQASIRSLGSSSSVMGSRDGALGLTAGGAAVGGAAAATSSSSHLPAGDQERPASPASPQTFASSQHNPQFAQFAPASPTNPFMSSTSQNAPSLTGADAASISAAYRSALSQPNFEETPPEGSTPEEEGKGTAGDEVLQRELEKAGMVVRGVKRGTGGDVRDGGRA